MWAFLALAIVAVRDNRKSQALLVLIPLLAIILLWLGFKKLMRFQSSDAEMFDMMIFSLLVGISTLLLLGHKIARPSRLATFILAIAIMIFSAFIGAISYGLTDLSQQTTMTVVLVVLMGFIIVASMAMAARSCCKKFTAPRFVLWQGFWIIVTSFICIALLFVVMMTIETYPDLEPIILLQIAMVSLVLGLCISIIALPYTILALRSGLFRTRLQACLQLTSMNPAEPQPTTALLADQQEKML